MHCTGGSSAEAEVMIDQHSTINKIFVDTADGAAGAASKRSQRCCASRCEPGDALNEKIKRGVSKFFFVI